MNTNHIASLPPDAMKLLLILILLITNLITIHQLREEKAWSKLLMETPGVEDLTCSDDYTVILKSDL